MGLGEALNSARAGVGGRDILHHVLQEAGRKVPRSGVPHLAVCVAWREGYLGVHP